MSSPFVKSWKNLRDAKELRLMGLHRWTWNAGTSCWEFIPKSCSATYPDKRDTYIMVTMPHQAAYDYGLIKELLAGGMDCFRINCAHDDAEVWSRMIDNLRRAEKELNKKCRIFMDLAGHKLRTGPIENVPPVVHWSPKHDGLGKNTAPARIWLTPAEYRIPPASPVDACVPVPLGWLSGLEAGDHVEFKDTRDRQRTMEVVAVIGNCRIAECHKSAYLTNGTILIHKPNTPENRAAGE